MIIGVASVLYREKGFPHIHVPTGVRTVGIINEVATFTGSTVGADHLLRNEANLGFGAAVRQGVEVLLEQGCTHFLILNPDTFSDETMLPSLVAGMERTGADIVQSVILCADGKHINTDGNTLVYIGISTCRNHGSTTLPQEDKKILAASGACLLITREAWQHLDGFDDSFFMYQEDTDLSWRAAMLGLTAYCIHDAFCMHDFELRLPAWKFTLLEQNRIQMVLQNYQTKTLVTLLPLLFFFECGMLAYSITQGFFWGKLKGYRSVMQRLPKILQRRRVLQKSRQRSDQEILIMMDNTVTEVSLQNVLVQRVLNPLLHWYYRYILGIVVKEKA